MWDPDGAGPAPPLLVVCGVFQIPGPAPAVNVATFDPASNTWAPIGSWSFGYAVAATTTPSGDLLVAGWDIAARQSVVMRWNGTTWVQVGGVFTHSLGFNGDIDCLTCTPNGDVFACGNFNDVGGVPHGYISRWDGTTWSSPGGGMDNYVDCMLTMPNGDLVAGGAFSTAGGIQTGTIARWDGTSWNAIAGWAGGWILAMTLAADGSLWVGGLFGIFGRWNGSTMMWLPPAPNHIEGLAVLPNGDVLAGGYMPTGVVRWNGSAWVIPGSPVNGVGRTFATLPGGDVIVGGWFNMTGSTPSPGIARLTTTCPASVTPIGVGCAAGSGVTTASLPWIGANWSVQATGLPTQSFVVGVQGFATANTPLSTLLPQGQPGCSLLVSPDHVGWMANTNGAATAQFAIPDNTALVGAVFHHQVIAFAHNPALAIANVTASNALTLTIGSF